MRAAARRPELLIGNERLYVITVSYMSYITYCKPRSDPGSENTPRRPEQFFGSGVMSVQGQRSMEGNEEEIERQPQDLDAVSITVDVHD